MIKERLKSARRMRGLSVRELAALAGVSHETISRYERGVMKPSSTVLIRIARALDLPIEYFLRPSTISLIIPLFPSEFKLPKKVLHQITEGVRDFAERYVELETLLDMKPTESFKQFLHELSYDLIDAFAEDEQTLSKNTIQHSLILDLIRSYEVGILQLETPEPVTFPDMFNLRMVKVYDDRVGKEKNLILTALNLIDFIVSKLRFKYGTGNSPIPHLTYFLEQIGALFIPFTIMFKTHPFFASLLKKQHKSPPVFPFVIDHDRLVLLYDDTQPDFILRPQFAQALGLFFIQWLMKAFNIQIEKWKPWAGRFARVFLIPEAGLKEYVHHRKHLTSLELSILSHVWGVDQEFMLVRLYEIHAISLSHFRKIKKELSRSTYSPRGAFLKREIPFRFILMVEYARSEDILSPSKIDELIGIPYLTFKEFVQKAMNAADR